jgi:hypothetical protein
MNLLFSPARWRSSNPLHVFSNCDPHSSALRVHFFRKMALAPKSAALAGNSSSLYVDLGGDPNDDHVWPAAFVPGRESCAQ